ncbi:GNAT family N-acetyltransferase, partial [Solemya velum gill symbiont]
SSTITITLVVSLHIVMNKLPLNPITLHGKISVLQPMESCHHDVLFSAIRNPEMQRYLLLPLDEERTYTEWFDNALSEMNQGESLAFVIRDIGEGNIVGCTRLMNYNTIHSSVEIGWTMIALECWRKGYSRESKLLLLSHAFEQLQIMRVQITTDINNSANMQLLESLGAHLDGILRKERRLPNGTFRDSAYFSVLAEEWPSIKINNSDCFTV